MIGPLYARRGTGYPATDRRNRKAPAVRLAPLAVLFALTLVALVPEARAQGFQVRPLFVDGEVPPGTRVTIPVEISPTSQIEGRTIDVEVVELTQNESGGFRAMPYDPANALPRSAAPWIEAPSEVTIEARETELVEVEMAVPFAARGSYAAALLLSAPPPEDAEGLRLTLRVLVPIVVGTEGRPARQDVRLSGADLRYRQPEGEDADAATPETTLVDALVENNGGTFSSVEGALWVDVKDEGGDWRQVRRVDIAQRRILPETAITLPVDLGRLLPGGDYRLRGELYVDGRRTQPLRREIAFEGHPEVQALVTDIDLEVEPLVFEYAYQPGATRSGRIAVTNPAIDPIEVSVDVEIPEGMAGRASATVRDTDLSAADWIEVVPARFTLRPGQTRNLRLLARFPDEAPAHQNAYAALKLSAEYRDGQRAGTATGLVEVTRAEGEDTPDIGLEPLRLASTEEAGRYALALRATNTGDVLLRPEVEYRVLDTGGARIVGGALEAEEGSPLMPLAARRFGGTLEADTLPDGELTLLTLLTSGGAEIGEVVQTLTKDDEGRLILQSPE